MEITGKELVFWEGEVYILIQELTEDLLGASLDHEAHAGFEELGWFPEDGGATFELNREYFRLQ